MVKIKLEKLEENDELTINKPKLKNKEKRKKRLRSLVKTVSKIIIDCVEEKGEENPENPDKEKVIHSRWKWKSLALAGVIVIASYFITHLSISSCGFWATFENNYNKIVHGDERWCYLELESTPILQQLKERVVGQDDALSLIRGSLDLANREKIIQMAFKGSTGVGKTLSSNIIMENFKWQENVISMIFDINFKADLKDEDAYENDFDEVLQRLNDCGFNLVVIDDVESTDSTVVKRITKLERRLHRIARRNLYKIILIVIFKGSTEEPTLEQKLSNFVLVEFQPFTEEMFQKCIEIHEKLNNIKLAPKDIEELKFINFTYSGCKTLAKKLNLIAKK